MRSKDKELKQVVNDRKTKRNALRELYGNKGIKTNWHKQQVEKYGKNKYITMVQQCDPRKRRNKLVEI